MILIVEDKPPWNGYCLECNFIEQQPTEEGRAALSEILDRQKQSVE